MTSILFHSKPNSITSFASNVSLSKPPGPLKTDVGFYTSSFPMISSPNFISCPFRLRHRLCRPQTAGCLCSPATGCLCLPADWCPRRRSKLKKRQNMDEDEDDDLNESDKDGDTDKMQIYSDAQVHISNSPPFPPSCTQPARASDSQSPPPCWQPT